nr:protein translocase subunit SecF [Campylobacter lari]
MQFFSQKHIYDFMRMRFAAISLSFILFFGSIFILFTKGLNFGIDFTGGTLVQLQYEQKAPLAEIRKALSINENLKGASVTEFGGANEVIIRFSGSSDSLGSDIGVSIANLLKDTGKFEVRRVDVVGPKVGDELRNKGLMAVGIS